jgi:hypothetical protein
MGDGIDGFDFERNFCYFVIAQFRLLGFVSDSGPRRSRVGVFCFCVFICNLIFVKENVKWDGGDFELMWWLDEMIFVVLPCPINLR